MPVALFVVLCRANLSAPERSQDQQAWASAPYNTTPREFEPSIAHHQKAWICRQFLYFVVLQWYYKLLKMAALRPVWLPNRRTLRP